METTELYQVVILWFVTAIFLQTTSGDSGPIATGIALLASGLLWVLPVYLLVRITWDLTDWNR